MNETELRPIVYSAWPNDDIVDAITWSPNHLLAKATTTNETVVDEIFDWNKKDTKLMLDYPPVFPRFPIPFNTVLNMPAFSFNNLLCHANTDRFKCHNIKVT